MPQVCRVRNGLKLGSLGMRNVLPIVFGGSLNEESVHSKNPSQLLWVPLGGRVLLVTLPALSGKRGRLESSSRGRLSLGPMMPRVQCVQCCGISEFGA